MVVCEISVYRYFILFYFKHVNNDKAEHQNKYALHK